MESFLDSRTNKDGVLSAEDDAAYTKMENDLNDLTTEIKRMERKEALEAEMNNIINPDGIYAYLQQPQSFDVTMGIGATKNTIEYVSMGQFYFSTASAEDASLTAEITAYDWFIDPTARSLRQITRLCSCSNLKIVRVGKADRTQR